MGDDAITFAVVESGVIEPAARNVFLDLAACSNQFGLTSAVLSVPNAAVTAFLNALHRELKRHDCSTSSGGVSAAMDIASLIGALETQAGDRENGDASEAKRLRWPAFYAVVRCAAQRWAAGGHYGELAHALAVASKPALAAATSDAAAVKAAKKAARGLWPKAAHDTMQRTHVALSQQLARKSLSPAPAPSLQPTGNVEGTAVAATAAQCRSPVRFRRLQDAPLMVPSDAGDAQWRAASDATAATSGGGGRVCLRRRASLIAEARDAVATAAERGRASVAAEIETTDAEARAHPRPLSAPISALLPNVLFAPASLQSGLSHSDDNNGASGDSDSNAVGDDFARRWDERRTASAAGYANADAAFVRRVRRAADAALGRLAPQRGAARAGEGSRGRLAGGDAAAAFAGGGSVGGAVGGADGGRAALRAAAYHRRQAARGACRGAAAAVARATAAAQREADARARWAAAAETAVPAAPSPAATRAAAEAAETERRRVLRDAVMEREAEGRFLRGAGLAVARGVSVFRSPARLATTTVGALRREAAGTAVEDRPATAATTTQSRPSTAGSVAVALRLFSQAPFPRVVAHVPSQEGCAEREAAVQAIVAAVAATAAAGATAAAASKRPLPVPRWESSTSAAVSPVLRPALPAASRYPDRNGITAAPLGPYVRDRRVASARRIVARLDEARRMRYIRTGDVADAPCGAFPQGPPASAPIPTDATAAVRVGEGEGSPGLTGEVRRLLMDSVSMLTLGCG